MIRTSVLILAAMLTAPVATAQTPAAAPVTPSAAAAPVPANPVAPLQPHGYDYKPAGRRDPFVSLVRTTAAVSGVSSSSRPTGIGGLSVDEIVMRGIVKGRNGWSAIVKGVDSRTYTLHAGDQLYDGSVRAVTADAMYVLQDVNDPLSTQKTREIRKPLRPAQEAQ